MKIENRGKIDNQGKSMIGYKLKIGKKWKSEKFGNRKKLKIGDKLKIEKNSEIFFFQFFRNFYVENIGIWIFAPKMFIKNQYHLYANFRRENAVFTKSICSSLRSRDLVSYSCKVSILFCLQSAVNCNAIRVTDLSLLLQRYQNNKVRLDRYNCPFLVLETRLR